MSKYTPEQVKCLRNLKVGDIMISTDWTAHPRKFIVVKVDKIGTACEDNRLLGIGRVLATEILSSGRMSSTCSSYSWNFINCVKISAIIKKSDPVIEIHQSV